jgi:hypothetical protein
MSFDTVFTVAGIIIAFIIFCCFENNLDFNQIFFNFFVIVSIFSIMGHFIIIINLFNIT